MNIVFITHYSSLYGANSSLLEVILNMKIQYNVNPIVISSTRGEFNDELDKHNIINYNLQFHNWVIHENDYGLKKYIKYLRYKIINFFKVKKIVKFLKDKNIDIVHTNSSVIDVGAKVAKKIKCKHVWHLREFGKEDYNLDYYVGLNKASKFINDNSDSVICISKALINKYLHLINKDKLKLVYNGINEKKYYVNIENKDYTSSFNIVFTGLISRKKNQIELLKAINILINEKKCNLKVYFLGGGDTEYLEELKLFCKKKGLINNVLFEGKVKNVNEYIKKSHIGIICSENEAFGRVTIEYMIGGLAVIASNTGANEEIITNYRDGLVYELGNIDELSEKIEYLYNYRERLKELSINAQRSALNRFTSDINCMNIYEIYKDILTNNNKVDDKIIKKYFRRG